MKKLVFALLFLVSFGIYAQGGPKVDVVKFRGEVTTTIRNTFNVPVGETWLIWNVTTAQLELGDENEVWTALSAGGASELSDLTDVNTSTPTDGNVLRGDGVDFESTKLAATDLANGTDGELITWDAAGVVATVPVGTSGHVLTSNGVGAAPTFQASGSGTVTSVGSGRTNPISISDIYGQTQADFDTDGDPPADEFVVITDAKVVYYQWIPLSAQGASLSTGTDINSYFSPVAITITDVWATVGTPCTGADIVVDINQGTGTSTSILSTKISIETTDYDSTSHVTQPVISDATIPAFQQLRFDIDQVGSTLPGNTLTAIIAYTID